VESDEAKEQDSSSDSSDDENGSVVSEALINEHRHPVRIISVSDIRGNPARLQSLPLPPNVDLTEYSLAKHQLVDETQNTGGFPSATEGLVQRILDVMKGSPIEQEQVLFFLAHGLGGTVLKQVFFAVSYTNIRKE